MQVRNTQAILLRRISYGDNDLIVTLFTPEAGKLTVIAKSAKKSRKRFPGILELFSLLTVVYSQRQRSKMPLLNEAVLKDAFIHIRADILKTAYAGYWVELINFWLPECRQEPQLYRLLKETLSALDQSRLSTAVLSIYFQMKFLNIAGLTPNLDTCCLCQTQTEGLQPRRIEVSLGDGGVVCCNCRSNSSVRVKFRLSKGTLKQLSWIAQRNLATVARVRFTDMGLKEALDFLESFVPYHMGKTPKSLNFLQRLRSR